MQQCNEEEAILATGADGAAESAKKRLSGKVVLAYLLCASIWGTTWYAIRVCIAPGAFPVYPAAALRFSLSALVLSVIWLALIKKLKRPTRSELKWILFAGTLSGVAYGLLYVAEEHLTGGIAAVISATGPLIAAMIAVMTRTESSSKMTIFGSLIAIIGVALVFHDRLQVSPDQASAVVLLTVVCVLNASSNVAMKRFAHNVVALACNTIFFAAAAVTLWICSILSGHYVINNWSFLPTAALLYLTIFGTLIAFASFFYLLKHVRLSTAMTLAFVTPIIALGVDAIFEKNAVLTVESYVGIAVVLCGVAVSVLFKDKLKSDRDATKCDTDSVVS